LFLSAQDATEVSPTKTLRRRFPGSRIAVHKIRKNMLTDRPLLIKSQTAFYFMPIEVFSRVSGCSRQRSREGSKRLRQESRMAAGVTSRAI
jgi:hypothetical protein